MSKKVDENQNPQSANVLQLGFNISVSGDPGTNFQIVLDDKGQASVQSVQNENQIPSSSDVLQLQDSTAQVPKHEVETKEKLKEVKPAESTEVPLNHNRYSRHRMETPKMSEAVNQETATSKDIIDEIKSTMEHFEKFSDHIKEVPRLKSCPLATSSPLQNRPNSLSESRLFYGETRPRRYSHLYDFHSRRDYFKGTVKPLPPDLFLKPLPAEGYYRKSCMTRYLDLETFKHFGSVDNLSSSVNQSISTYSKPKYDLEKYEADISDVPTGILKKTDSESGDKQSTSSADSVKDIKIYQSGGILIMQNFKDNWDTLEKKEISDFSAKLIENCNKLREEINSGFLDTGDKPFFGNSSDEGRNSGKMVQFDLSGCENHKSKSGDSSSVFPKDESSSARLESSGSNSDCIKTKDTSPLGTSLSQDFPSLSTQENDSVISNPPGMSPTYVTSGKKLEWDSGADVGYLNLDLSKENLSTIERIVLKGLSSDGLNEKNVVYEKQPEQPHANRSKFILERLPSELLLEEVIDASKNAEGGDKNTCSFDNKKADKKSSIQSVEAKESKNLLNEDFDKNDKGQNESRPKPQPPPVEQKAVKATLELEKTRQDAKSKRERSESVDKSVNVNTLFQDDGTQISSGLGSDRCKRTESQTKVKTPKLSPKVKKLKKKRITNHRASLTAPLKDKIDSIIDIAKCSSRSSEGKLVEMGVPKKIYKKIEANPELKEVELSRDMEEIIIDQRFKIKQSVGIGREATKKGPFTVTSDEIVDSKTHVKTKSRPISASSSSNNTVLPNSEVREVEKKNSSEVNKIKVSSVGIQAFSSEKSSVRDDGTVAADERKEVPKKKKNEREINTSSKNIQVFGLNSSLPKQLAHPKETKLIETQNTKGTQFFGGPINSLPNYHSNLVVKPAETCGRAPQILKTKRTSKTEIIRLNEENKKNVIDVPKSISEPSERLKKGCSDAENKENLNTETSANSRKSQSKKAESENNGGCGDINKNGSDAFDTQTSRLSKEVSWAGDSNSCRVFDEVSCKVLTSDLLKEHGHSIDRNIIQEKYFQSQLVEIVKREMTSKSTSMERQLEHDKDVQTTLDYKKSVNVSCQYSPKSKSTSDRVVEKQDHEGMKADEQKKKRLTSEQCDSSQNMVDEFGTLKSTNQEQDFGAGDSLQSSTQTAHSWVPGMQDSGQNGSNAVGRARSFEYLPGHIYESNGNLREELPSETENNLISCSSSGSSAFEEAKLSVSKESEGRNTLVLETSEETSLGSGRMKILNENLTQLDIVVSKLREKDAQIQCVTQSLLVNFWSKNYCEDNCRVLGATDPQRTEEAGAKDEWKDSKESENGSPVVSSLKAKKMAKELEISIGCQTEGKSSNSGSNKYSEEKKVLEKRISEGKESQIKWIENEIYHLNILRELLEKQSFPSQRRKKRSLLSITGDSTSKSEENYPRNISAEVYSRPVTPVYSCNVSLAQSKMSRETDSSLERSNSPDKIQEKQKRQVHGEPLKYGMAVSISGNAKNFNRMVMIPVGVQVTLKKSDFVDDCGQNKISHRENEPTCSKNLSSSLSSQSPEAQFMIGNRKMARQADMNTQYPSLGRETRNISSSSAEMNCQSTSVQVNLLSPVICRLCQLENCVCLNLTGKSDESTERSFKSNQKITFEKESSVRSFMAFPADDVEDQVVGNHSDGRRVRDVGALLSEDNPLQPNQMSSRTIESYGSSCHPTSSQKHKQECYSKKPPVNHETPGAISRNSRQSIVHQSRDNSVEKFECCRCSKIQVEKSSSCTCHIIKIHGPKCCSRENGTCSSRTRSTSAVKKTENQSCQTDDVLNEEDSVKSSNRGEMSEKREKKIASGGNIETKAVKNSEAMTEQLPCQEKAPDEGSNLRSDDAESSEKSALDRKRFEEPAYEKPLKVCHCKNREKGRKQKPKVDDHPRHYFLKIEETEIDERDIQSIEERKSLEVITVTVPVKKPWKTKPRELTSSKGNSLESNTCFCCKDCFERIDQDGKRDRDRSKWKHEENKSERADLPKRTKPQRRRLVEYDSDEDRISSEISNDVECKNMNPQWSSSRENSQQNSSLNQIQSGSFFSCSSVVLKSNGYFEGGSKKLENENDYDSHKVRNQKNENLYYNCEKADKNERCRKGSPDNRYRREDDTSFDSKQSRPQKYIRGTGPNDSDYYNYNKREFMTKSELLREKAEKSKAHHPSLQECLASNRPDFYSSAESRRQIISERAKERVKKHTNRMECLISLIHQCSEESKKDTKRIFTTAEMREQTRKRYKKLPEVTGKLAERKKKEEYRTNKIMADIFAKKLQLEALKGHINLSNSVSVLATI